MKTFESFAITSRQDDVAASIASDVINLIQRIRSNSKIDVVFQYRSLANATVHLHVTRGNLPAHADAWEVINFKRKGFVLDANSYAPAGSEPGINLDIVISPEAEDYALPALELSIIDAVSHEINHTLRSSKGDHLERNRSQDSYRYFLLPDEIPAMVSGLSASAKKEGISLATAASDYLTPFVESGFMTVEEFDEVMHAWLDYANSH